MGGGEHAQESRIYFNPNIPSEECFTSPKKGEAEGIVYSSKPLSYNGEIIDNFWIRFKDGKAIEWGAEKNADLLGKMLTIDENAGYLGECALIPYDSPINNTGILFYNTLFDENASCHLAIGRGFTNLVKDYDKYTLEELNNMGINYSLTHVDFMIGTSDMCIEGETYDGKKVTIFKDGNWAF
jgi:aminopeptidase